MGRPVEFIEHEACGSSRLQVFEGEEEGEYNGFCFGCRSYVHTPYQDKPSDYKPRVSVKTPEEIAAEIAEYADYQTVTLHDRMLGKPALETYGIKIGLDGERAVDPVTHHYPYYKDGKIVAYKNRVIETKAMWSVGEMKGVDFFGWEVAKYADNRRLYICEGEIDAVTVYQMIMKSQRGTPYAENIPAVVSLPTGASNADKVIAAQADKLALFKEVVLVFDNDKAGKLAIEATMKVAPKCITVTLPEKDPNACLTGGREKAATQALMWKAERPKSTRLVWGEDLHEKAREQAQWGLSWPWDGLTQKTRGVRFGETYYIGAGVNNCPIHS